MKSTKAILYTIVITLLTLFVAGCQGGGAEQSLVLSNLTQELEEGDLVFRRGTGVVGRIVTSVDVEGQYSHVGVAVLRDSAWYVVHAVPHEPDFEGDIDRVKCEPLANFVGRYKEGAVGLYRVNTSRECRDIAVENALRLSRENRPFDHDYDALDTSKLYCTELVEHIYTIAGISLSGGRRTKMNFPALTGDYIMPSDLTESELLIHIY